MILIVGGTGHIGSLVVRALSKCDVQVCALSDASSPDDPPPNVAPVRGDVRDVDFMRALLGKTRTLFLLNPVVPDEMVRALLTINLAAAAGIQRVVYFSMVNADTFGDVPHAAAKYAAERMIAQLGIQATILRPNYFFQNDAAHQKALLDDGVYPMPIGRLGVSMVDTRDIAEVAARELVQREQSPHPLPTETIEIVGPERFTGDSIAKLWSDVLGRSIHYGGDDLAAFEAGARAQFSSSMAYDTALMFRGFHRDGMFGAANAAQRLEAMLGRSLRTYRAFAEEMKSVWQKQRHESSASDSRPLGTS
jgi:uncharacterized protein YbjT (DUF2867 family)